MQDEHTSGLYPDEQSSSAPAQPVVARQAGENTPIYAPLAPKNTQAQPVVDRQPEQQYPAPYNPFQQNTPSDLDTNAAQQSATNLTPDKSSKKRFVLAAVISAVVVIALSAGAVALFFLSNKPENNETTESATDEDSAQSQQSTQETREVVSLSQNLTNTNVQNFELLGSYASWTKDDKESTSASSVYKYNDKIINVVRIPGSESCTDDNSCSIGYAQSYYNYTLKNYNSSSSSGNPMNTETANISNGEDKLIECIKLDFEFTKDDVQYSARMFVRAGKSYTAIAMYSEPKSDSWGANATQFMRNLQLNAKTDS